MKAQVWSIDTAFSIAIFLTALLMIFFSINTISNDIMINKELESINTLTLSISDALVRLPGFPKDWNRTTVRVLGLARDENILDEYKVSEMLDIDYDTLRVATGAGKYNIHISLFYINGSIAKDSYGRNITAGLLPTNPDYISRMERYCIYRGELTKLRISLWY